MTQLEQLKAEFAKSTEEFARRIAALEAQEEPELKDGDDCYYVDVDGTASGGSVIPSIKAHDFPRTDSGKLRAERVGKRFRAMREPAKEPFREGDEVWVVYGDGYSLQRSAWEGDYFHRMKYRLGMVHKTKAEAESWLAENRDAFWGPFGGVE